MPNPSSQKHSLSEKIAAFDAAAELAPSSIWIARRKVGQALAEDAPELGIVSTVTSKPALNAAWSGSLAGKTVAVKDNIDVAGFATTAACPAYAYSPECSAQSVAKLESAGAVIVGKTNLDQFACGLVGTRSPYGTVPNTFNPDYVSGGSSSGSAVAVALGLVDIALGTDTAGSGRIPAGFNNIVGLKPSRGLISTRGMLPACQHIDCISIFALTVPEVVDALHVMAGYDAEDPFSRSLELDARPMPQRFRFGIPDAAHLKFFGDKLAEAAFAEALQKLRELDGTSVEINFAPMSHVASALYEEAWVAERYAAIKTFFDAQPGAVDPVVRTIIESGMKYSAADLFQAMVKMNAWQQDAANIWQEMDVLVVPTAPTIYRIDAIRADPVALNRNLGTYTNFVNLLDLAAIAVPSSIRPDGLPFGITLIGPAGSDLRLADLAQRYHQATGLSLGATGRPMPAPQAIQRSSGTTVRVAVVGAHLSGLPLNGQLLERGAFLLGKIKTAPKYRFYALANTVPPKPGLVRVGPDESGAAIEAEIWEMPLEHYGSFVALIPPPLGIVNLEFETGEVIQGFGCESAALAGALDITAYGGWRAYLASQ